MTDLRITLQSTAPDFRANRPTPAIVDFDVEIHGHVYTGQCTVEDSATGRYDEDPSVSSYRRERVVEFDGLLTGEGGKPMPVFQQVRENIHKELEKLLSL
jgi:hypothetical protein